MKKNNFLFLKLSQLFFFFLLLGFFGCSPKVKPAEVPSKGDNSMVSLDWNGTYTGTIPCADCQGIETTLTLNQDKTYLLKTKYLGKSDKIQEKSGTFTWNTAGSSITLNGVSKSSNQYMVGENVLFQLDKSGNRITGNLENAYKLKKVQ